MLVNQLPDDLKNAYLTKKEIRRTMGGRGIIFEWMYQRRFLERGGKCKGLAIGRTMTLGNWGIPEK